jgi:hypothetical protein
MLLRLEPSWHWALHCLPTQARACGPDAGPHDWGSKSLPRARTARTRPGKLVASAGGLGPRCPAAAGPGSWPEVGFPVPPSRPGFRVSPNAPRSALQPEVGPGRRPGEAPGAQGSPRPSRTIRRPVRARGVAAEWGSIGMPRPARPPLRVWSAVRSLFRSLTQSGQARVSVSRPGRLHRRAQAQEIARQLFSDSDYETGPGPPSP